MGKSEGHIVLYRKYRSRNFSEIVGQEHIVKALEKSVNSGKIAHAYLFTGPRGTGKTSIARIFAYAINGLDYQDQLPIDIIEIDGASNRRIDEVRELKERINTAPAQAKYKVYIIDEVHMLTKEAFNALLKTLEEPPEHAVFILATTEVNKLPATIISRTQRYSFKLMPGQTIAKHLAFICKNESITYEDSALLQIAEMGQGSMRDSISLLDQVHSSGDITVKSVESSLGITDHGKIEALLNQVESATPKEIVASLQEMLMNGASANQIAGQIINAIRNTARVDTKWLDLIDELILASSSPRQDISLEVALLRANIGFNPQAKLTPTKEVPAKTVPAKIKTDATKEKETTELPPKPQLNKPSQPTNSKPIDKQSWDEILAMVKNKNNALYSLLRMAEATFDNNNLKLEFKYDFHKKQIEASKALIIDYASEVIGQTISLELSVSKQESARKPEPASVSTDTKSILETFGGGEVVSL